MENVATINFQEESGEKCVVIVRAQTDCLGLAISRESDGDIEVFLKGLDAQRLYKALGQALKLCQS